MAETHKDLPVIAFASDEEWDAWLRANGEGETGLWVKLAKKGNAASALSKVEAMRTALCWGWIDGQVGSWDDDWYVLRFTPRRARSIWSQVNVRHVAELEAEGRMQPAGRDAFARRKEHRSGTYSYEQRPEAFDGAMLATFRKAKGAFRYFEAQAASYRRAAIWWVISARQEATRERRLAHLIEVSAEERWLEQMVKYTKPRRGAASATGEDSPRKKAR